MPSPFPGMDPYLESPLRWRDVHHSLAGQNDLSIDYGQPPIPPLAQGDVEWARKLLKCET